MILQVVEHATTDAAPVELPAALRVVYRVEEDDARLSAGPVTLGAGRALCFELVEEGSPDALLRAPVELDPAAGLLVRCDRVDFPPGGVARLHTHQGPGIRVLLRGSIRIDSCGTSTPVAPGQAWFEAGPAPVFAATSGHEPSAFVRCMLLPPRLQGASSIRYVHAEDAAKPKDQRYRVYVDEPVALPVAR